VIDFLSRAEGVTLAAIVFGAVLAESMVVTDLVVPGEAGLVVAGAAAAANGTPVALVIGAAALGAVAGDTIGYLVGRTAGVDVITSRRWARRLRPGLSRARHHFDEHGPLTFAAARWIGALRGVMPLAAGSAGVPAPRFYVPAAISAVAWSAAVTLLGFHLGDEVADVIDRAGLIVSAVVIVAIVAGVWIVRHRRRARATP
jgi:undecaprenyl-diphosphatase